MTEWAIRRMTCPTCSAPIEHREDLSPWCAICQWNVDPLSQPVRDSRTARVQRRIADRATRGLNQAVVDSAGTARPRLRPIRVVAVTFACLVHGVTLVLLVGGVWVMVVTPWRVGGIVIGVIMIATGCLFLPRPPRLPKNVQAIDQSKGPVLNELIKAMAADVGVPSPSVAVAAQFNAWTTTYGWRRRPWLVIGLPLWDVLSEQERVALLGHELAHFGNGDVRRSGIVGTALLALRQWRILATPPRANAWGYRRAGRAFALAALSDYVSRILFAWLGAMAWTFETALALATARDSQQAEYWADAMSVRLGGRRAAEGLIRKLLVVGTYDVAVTSAIRRRDSDAMQQAAAVVRALPESELDRRVLAESTRSRSVFASHPPADLRLAFVHSREETTAAVVLDTGRSRLMDNELGAYRPAVAKALAWARGSA